MPIALVIVLGMTSKHVGFLALSLALSTFAATAHADEPPPAADPPVAVAPPVAEHRETRMQPIPIVAGSVLLGASYATGVIGGAMLDVCLNVFGPPTPCDHPHWPMYIPVAGPFIALGTASAANRLDGASAAFMIADGIAQVASLSLLVYGLAARVPVERKAPVSFVPVVGDRSYGLAAVGTF